MGPRASGAPASRTRVVKPLARTHLFHPQSPLHEHLQPQGLLLVGFLLTQRETICHGLHKAGPELLFNQLRGQENSSSFMLQPYLHQPPLSTISMQHPSSPACSLGTWHQGCNQVL